MSHRREISLQHLGPLGLLGKPFYVGVSLGELLTGFGHLRVVELLGEQLGFDPFPPPLVKFLGRLAPLEVIGVGDTTFIECEIVFGLDESAGHLDLATNSLEKSLVNGKGKLDVPSQQLVIEFFLELAEHLDVPFDEVELQRVDRLEVTFERLLRDVVVDLLLADVKPVDQLADHLGRLLVFGGWIELLGTDCSSGQQQQSQETRRGHSPS